MKIFLILLISTFFVLFSCSSDNSKGKSNATDSVSVRKMADSLLFKAEIDSLVWEIKQLHKDSALTYASMGIVIALDSIENIVYELNPNTSLVPASVTKLLTTATAMEKCAGARKTVLQYTGNIENGTLHGNIVIKGGGDPTLGRNGNRDYLQKWANAIKNLGIDSITGQIIGDGGVYEYEMFSPGWMWGEIMSYYSAPVTGLMVNDNQYIFTFNVNRKGLIKATPDNMKPFIRGTQFVNMTKSFKGDEAEVYFLSAPYSNTIEIYGYVPEGMSTLKMMGVFPDAPLAAASELARVLRQQGVKVSDSTTTMRKILVDYNFSIPDSLSKRRNIDSIPASGNNLIGEINKYSNNLFAETLLKRIGMAHNGSASRQAGLAGVYSYLSAKRIDTRGLSLFDGSGISRANAIPPVLLVQLLSHIKNKSSYFKQFKNTLSEAGENGTLARLCKNTNAQKRIFAKSGTMTRVVNYAGYAETMNGHTLIFAFMANNFTCSLPEMKEKFEKLMIRMADWKDKK